MKKSKNKLVPIKDGQTIYNGTPVNEFVQCSYKYLTNNVFTGDNEIKNGNVIISVEGNGLKYYDNDTVALFLYLVNMLHDTKQLKVEFALRDYALLCGYDVNNADKKIAKAELDKFRKRYNKALRTLYKLRVKWTENKGKAKGKDYDRRVFITGDGLHNGVAYVIINNELAEPLLNNAYITQVPRTAFLMTAGTGNKTITKNANKVLFKLSQHFNMSHNKANGSNNILKIDNILSWTNLQTIDELNKTNNRNYNKKIIEPLEAILNYLTEQTHDLLLWEYCKSKKEPINLDEMTDKELIQTGYIHFELATEQYPTLEAWQNAHKTK